MKKYLSVLFLIAFIIPSVAFASWWNPFSWFNNWSFNKEETPSVVEVNTLNNPDQVIKMTREEFKTKYGFYPNEQPDTKKDENVKPKSEPKTPATAKTTPKATPIKQVSQSEKAWKENEDLAKNIMPDVSIEDDHATHIAIHEKVVPKTWAVWFHIAWHQELLYGNKATLFLCNDKLYENYCPSGSYSCPVSGKPSCLYDENKDDRYVFPLGQKPVIPTPVITPKTSNQPSLSLEDILDDLNEKADGSWRECTDRKKELEEEIKAQIAVNQGFGTPSQIAVMALNKMKEEGMSQCFSGGSIINSGGGYSSTHCNSLNGGFDCTSSSGTRTYIVPIGNGSYDIRSY